jgi:hypothetical protein
MSRAGVGIVIDKLFADETVRTQFAIDRAETIAALCLQDVDLSAEEIELFFRTDPGLWFVGDGLRGEWNVVFH